MKLIVNGDDFGITHACNLALVDCFKNGVMRSASMLTNMPYAKEAASLWRENPELSVGIHFSLTVGRPLTGAKTIVKQDGAFGKMILKDYAMVDPGEIRAELEAQFERFIELTGRLPDHINSHHGIERIPFAAEHILELSRKYHLPHRWFLTENNVEELGHQTEFQTPKLRMLLKDGGKGFVSPEDVIAAFNPEELESNEIFELAGHPGYVDRELLLLSSLTEARCYDAYNFSCDQVKSWVRAHRIELITYKDIPRREKDK